MRKNTNNFLVPSWVGWHWVVRKAGKMGYWYQVTSIITWWRHQMETFSALLALSSPVDSPHKCQWRGALVFSLICAWTNDWANNWDDGDLRRHRAHYDVTVMKPFHCRDAECLRVSFSLCWSPIVLTMQRKIKANVSIFSADRIKFLTIALHFMGTTFSEKRKRWFIYRS